ncbi:MAG: FecR family protein [Proteobacteria bacterium]|nr:FecR family protein [Pseudomonadota bacterium]
MPDQSKYSLNEQALRWLVILRDPSADENDRLAFERWRQADADHEAAWKRAQAVWSKADILKLGLAQSSAKNAVPLSLTDSRSRIGRRRWLQAAGGAVMASSAAFLATRPALWPDYRTSPGERRTVTLLDGSIVELGGASALSVSFSGVSRRLELLAGEAFFSVARDTARPFIVEAVQGRTRAIGTAFNIKRIDDSIIVTVVERQVEVSTDLDARIEKVTQGQQVRYRAGHLKAPQPADLLSVEGWRHGRLVFQDAPLGEVVADLERCLGGRIIFANSRLRALPVTAVFDANQAGAALGTIARTLPIQLHHLTKWFVVLSPKS